MGRSKELFEYLSQSDESAEDPVEGTPDNEAGSPNTSEAPARGRQQSPLRAPEEVARAFAESHGGRSVPFLGASPVPRPEGPDVADTGGSDHEELAREDAETRLDNAETPATVSPVLDSSRRARRRSQRSAKRQRTSPDPSEQSNPRKPEAVAPALRAAHRAAEARNDLTGDVRLPSGGSGSTNEGGKRTRKRERRINMERSSNEDRRAKRTSRPDDDPDAFVTFDPSEDPARASFGDQRISVTYNNAAILLLFFGSLVVLSYFLGFTQGIGSPLMEADPMIMSSAPTASSPDSWEERFSASGSIDDEGRVAADDATPSTFANGAPEAEADPVGVFEGQQPFWTIRLFTAEPGQRTRVEHYLNLLRKGGYDARIDIDGRGRHVLYAGRFDDRSAELEDLLAALRGLELDSAASEKGALPPFHDAFAVFHEP